MRARIFLLAVGILLMSGAAEAALVDRGSGMIYDTVLNVTWLQDANYAKTSGYDADGMMIWSEAKTWTANLVFYDSLRDKYWDNWRLPSVMNLDGSNPIEGYVQPGSEMGHLFYIDLKNPGWQPITNTFPFENVQADYYWFEEEGPGPIQDNAWYFNFALGYQNGRSRYGESYAWPVLPGDVGAVPIPGAVWLFGSGLVCLAAARKRHRQ